MTLGDGLRATQGQGTVGSSERGWIFLFSVSFVCLFLIHTEREAPSPNLIMLFLLSDQLTLGTWGWDSGINKKMPH